ncbi:MAG: DUF5958 family protein [Planctomycetota bacterium]
MKLRNGQVLLELSDLIRLNALVRGGVDWDGFEAWNSELTEQESRALLVEVLYCASQAGLSEGVVEDATRCAGFAEDDAFVLDANVHLRSGAWSEWADRLSEGVQILRGLRWSVHVFGAAEAQVLAGETPESCNHWWHRDLLDERVVAALLRDPQFWKTSMRDDAAIKGA